MESLWALDSATLYMFETLQRPWLVPVMVGLSIVGDRLCMSVLSFLLAGVFALAGRPRTACCLLATVLLGLMVFTAIKMAVHRQRPDLAWRPAEAAVPANGSFPSSHAFASMAILGGGAMLAARGLRRGWAQALVVLVAVFTAFCIGLSRVYLSLHYPLDVLAGLSGGLACALLAVWMDQRWGYQPRQTESSKIFPANDIVPLREDPV